jgi:hypothetical protein
MKNLFILLILFISLYSHAQYRDDSNPITDYTFDTTKYHHRIRTIPPSIIEEINHLINNRSIKIYITNEKAYVNDSWWYSLTSESKRSVTLAIAFYCGNFNENYKYPITIRSAMTKKIIATFIMPKKELISINTEKSIENLQVRTSYKKFKWNSQLNDYYDKIIERFERENLLLRYEKGYLVLSSLWDAWDEKLKDHMTFLMAVRWGNLCKDYSYNMTVKVLPSMDSGIPFKSIKELPIGRTFKRPPNDSMLEAFRKVAYPHEYNPNLMVLVQGEENKISFLLEEKKLFLDHSKRTAYIKPDVWENLSGKQKRIITTIIAVKCADDCRSPDYRLSLYNLKDKKQIYATYNNKKYKDFSL